jgi:phosphoglycerol transferase MdoB-like AlkP superfamily enzyme
MRLAKTISDSKIANIFLLVMGFLLTGLGFIALLFGIYAILHSLMNQDAGLDDLRFGMGLGSLVYGPILLFLGIIGIKNYKTSDTNL